MSQELTRINRALDVELAATAAQLRAMKPQERQMRASRLADLYEVRARLFKDSIVRMAEFVPMTEVELVGTALARAIDKDEDSVKFWRHEAGAR